MPDLDPTQRPLVAGRYALETCVGRGGMGEVWEATDTRLQCPVAVKLLNTHGNEGVELSRRFLREARLAAAVRHPNVVHATDFGLHEGVPFMVMEYCQGGDLLARVDRGPLPIEDAVAITVSVLRGLGAIHDQGILHRDIKPENVFMVETPDGPLPKILDFGVSKVIAPETGRRSAMTTQHGFVIGTPHYMSPEAARGVKDLDERADIYSVGVLLYEMLTGTVPFDSANPGDLLLDVITGTAEPVTRLRPETPPAIVAVVERAMARERTDRFSDTREFVQALYLASDLPGFGDSSTTLAVVPHPTPSGVRATRRALETEESVPFGVRATLAADALAVSPPRTALLAIAAVALAAVMGLGYFVAPDSDARASAPEKQAVDQPSVEVDDVMGSPPQDAAAVAELVIAPPVLTDTLTDADADDDSAPSPASASARPPQGAESRARHVPMAFRSLDY